MFSSGWALTSFPPHPTTIANIFLCWVTSPKTGMLFSIVEMKQTSSLSESQKCPTVRKNVFHWPLACPIPTQPFLLAPFSRRAPGADCGN